MKQLILTLMLLMVSTSTAFALHLKDVLYTNGKDNTHFAYWDEVENEDYIHFTKPKNFIIYLNDSIIRVDNRSVEGLFSNDFDKFYHDQPIGQMKPLRRETPENIDVYYKAKADMEEIRQNCKNGIMYKMVGSDDDSDNWGYKHDYNMESGSFTFKLPLIEFIHNFPNSRRLPPLYSLNPTKVMIASEELENKFKKEERSLGFSNITHIETVNKIEVPIANKKVAMEIEEVQPQYRSNRKHDYEFFYVFHLVDFIEYDKSLKTEKEKPCFEVTDVVLVQMPTQKVIWTAMTGDHSNE